MDADGTRNMSRKMETGGGPKNGTPGKYVRSSRRAEPSVRRDGHIYQHKRERFMADLKMVSPVHLLKLISVSMLTGRHGLRILVSIHITKHLCSRLETYAKYLVSKDFKGHFSLPL